MTTRQGTTYTTTKTTTETPDSITVTLKNPDDTTIVDEATPTYNNEDEQYEYDYTFPSDADLGNWKFTWTVIIGDDTTTTDEVVNLAAALTTTTTSILGKLDSSLFTIDTDVTVAEVTQAYNDAVIRAAAYLELTDTTSLPTGAMVTDAVYTWAAGLLWNLKINTESPNYQEDKKGETEGDKLINAAKAILDPFKETT